MYKYVFIIVFNLYFLNIYGQKSKWYFTSYNQSNGLSSSVLGEFSQGYFGYIWMPSENGLNRFDGYDFLVFKHDNLDSNSLSSSVILSTLVYDKNNILVVCSNSISVFNPISKIFKKICDLKYKSEIIKTFCDENGFWIIKKSKMVYYDVHNAKSTVYSYPTPEFIKSLYPSTDMPSVVFYQEKIFFTLGNRSVYFNPKTKKFYLLKKTLADNTVSKQTLLNNRNNELILLANNNIYFLDGFYQFKNTYTTNLAFDQLDFGAIYDGKIICLIKNNIQIINTKTGKINTLVLPKKYSETINNLYINKRDKDLIIATSQGPLLYNFETNNFEEIINENQALPEGIKNIENIFCTPNVIWFTSPGIGLIKAEKNIIKFKSFKPNPDKNTKPFINNNIRTFGQYNSSHLMVGSLHGLFLFNIYTHESIGFSYLNKQDQNTLSTMAISTIQPYKNGFLITNWHNKGIFILDTLHKTLKTFEYKNIFKNNPYSIRTSLISPDQTTLWLGGIKTILYKVDLNLFEKGNAKFYSEYNLQQIFDMQTSLIFTIKQLSANELLIGTDYGLYLFNTVTNTGKKYLFDAKNEFSITNNNIRSIFCISDSMALIGTFNGGIHLFLPKLGKFIAYQKHDGISDKTIYSIQTIDSINYWLGTNNGLSKFNLKDVSFINYNLKDGIQSTEFNTNAAFTMNKNLIAMGGINGFNLFYPNDVNTNDKIDAHIIIDKLEINSNAVNYDFSKPLDLNYDQNNIVIEFAKLQYYRSEDTKYAYQLVGIDPDWIYCKDRRIVNYTNLPPGDFIFKYKAANTNGEWQESKNPFSFTISKPWWLNFYFYLSLAVVVLFIAFVIYKNRINQMLKLINIRNQIARDLHDEVGSNLSNIDLFNHAIKEKLLQFKYNDLLPLVQKIQNYNHQSQEAMTDIVWMINPKNDYFKEIFTKMNEYAASITAAKNIHLHISYNEHYNNLKLDLYTRKNLYLIFKEAINNAVKYSNCKNLYINLIIFNKQHLELLIKDDGIGFDENVKRGNGLYNMKKRADEINASISINSTTNKGTAIKIILITRKNLFTK